jgi:micrococcal nuclease
MVRRFPLPGFLALLVLASLVVLTVVVGARSVRELAPGASGRSEVVADQHRPPGVPDDAEPAVVARIVDGDTIRILGAAGGQDRVRLLNVDAPELDHPAHGRECGAGAATELVEELLPLGATVWLADDREDRDRFGRLLRYAWTAEGVDVQAALVEAGLAEVLVVPPNDRFAAPLRSLERRAQADGTGTWGTDCPD